MTRTAHLRSSGLEPRTSSSVNRLAWVRVFESAGVRRRPDHDPRAREAQVAQLFGERLGRVGDRVDLGACARLAPSRAATRRTEDRSTTRFVDAHYPLHGPRILGARVVALVRVPGVRVDERRARSRRIGRRHVKRFVAGAIVVRVHDHRRVVLALGRHGVRVDTEQERREHAGRRAKGRATGVRRVRALGRRLDACERRQSESQRGLADKQLNACAESPPRLRGRLCLELVGGTKMQYT